MDLTVPLLGMASLSLAIAACCVIALISKPDLRREMVIVGLISGAVGWAFSWVLFAGLVVATDWHGDTVRAELVSSVSGVMMRRLGPFYFGSPDGKSVLRVTYADGTTTSCGYFDGLPASASTVRPLRC